MKRHPVAPLLVVGLALVAGPIAAETPSADTLVARAITAVDPDDGLATHDVIRAAVHEEETTTEGTSEARDFTVLLRGHQLQNLRLELGQGISVVLNDGEGWAVMGGQLDTRANASRMAEGTVRQKVFPLLFPYSLRLEGLRFGAVSEGSFDGSPVWAVEADFDPAFFASPSMATTWKLFFSRKDHRMLGAEFFPPVEFRVARSEGVRYRILTWKNFDGIELPGQLLLEGVDFDGIENGHVRVTKIDYTTAGPLDPTLFLHPNEVAKLDAGDVE